MRLFFVPVDFVPCPFADDRAYYASWWFQYDRSYGNTESVAWTECLCKSSCQQKCLFLCTRRAPSSMTVWYEDSSKRIKEFITTLPVLLTFEPFPFFYRELLHRRSIVYPITWASSFIIPITWTTIIQGLLRDKAWSLLALISFDVGPREVPLRAAVVEIRTCHYLYQDWNPPKVWCSANVTFTVATTYDIAWHSISWWAPSTYINPSKLSFGSSDIIPLANPNSLYFVYYYSQLSKSLSLDITVTELRPKPSRYCTGKAPHQ